VARRRKVSANALLPGRLTLLPALTAIVRLNGVVGDEGGLYHARGVGKFSARRPFGCKQAPVADWMAAKLELAYRGVLLGRQWPNCCEGLGRMGCGTAISILT